MKTLYIFSDSVATGQFVAPHKTWVHLLSANLAPRYLVQNASKNGETTRGALDRIIPEVLRYQPDVVYLQFGSNDANKWQTDKGLPRVTLAGFAANMQSLIECCVHFGVEVILGNNHISFVKGLEAYNEVIRQIADRAGLVMADHTHYTNGFLMPDRIHLNECGHQLYFETVVKAVTE